MTREENEGNYHPVCGGLPPLKIKSIPVDGKETGIDRLDEILADVAQLDLHDNDAIREALLRIAGKYNYIPPGMADAYAAALLITYKTRIVE